LIVIITVYQSRQDAHVFEPMEPNDLSVLDNVIGPITML